MISRTLYRRRMLRRKDGVGGLSKSRTPAEGERTEGIEGEEEEEQGEHNISKKGRWRDG